MLFTRGNWGPTARAVGPQRSVTDRFQEAWKMVSVVGPVSVVAPERAHWMRSGVARTLICSALSGA